MLDDDLNMDDEDEDTKCMSCNSLYSEDTKGGEWIRCMKFLKWSHEECVNSDKKK